MKKSFCLVSLFLMTLSAQAVDTKTVPITPAVKKSATGVCHGSESRFYSKLKKFTPYDNIKACLDSGGHMPGAGKAKG